MFHMTRSDNISYAKRNLVDSIYKEAHLEGISATYPDTKEIFEGRVVAGLSVDDTVAINNLKHAWQFIFDTLDVPIDFPYLRRVNQYIGSGLVSNSGQLRTSGVSIGGTSWRPDIPTEDTARSLATELSAAAGSPETILTAFAALCRAQLFYDGNKRTAQLVANKLLIESGCGVFAVPPECKPDWERHLIGYYESGSPSELVSFLLRTSIDGYDSAEAAASYTPVPDILRDALKDLAANEARSDTPVRSIGSNSQGNPPSSFPSIAPRQR